MYTDIQQGHLLLDLLEVLSGQHLPREKGFNTFQCRSNIENALTFLKSRSLKLINIHVADIIEGKPSIVLGLIWTIIFHFHIEELARTLAFTYNQPSLDCSSAVDSSPKTSRSAKKSAKIKERWKISATKALLLWAKEQCSLYGSINVTDFKSSWRSGLPFLAIIQTLRPGLVDLEKAEARSNKENLKEAFRIAELELNIPRLLEPEDVDIMDPDEKSIMTYVAQFLQYSRNLCESEEDTQVCLGIIELFRLEKTWHVNKNDWFTMSSSPQGLMNCFDSHLDTLQSFKNEDEKSMPLVLPEKLEEMKRRFSNISFTRSSTFLEYHYGLCSAIANEVMLKLNISDMKYGSKESVESLLENWNVSLKYRYHTQTIILLSHLSLSFNKLFKTVRSKISVCRDYISNVNTTLEKVLSSWSNYTENIHLLKMWLDENRDEHLKEIPAENLAKWNLVHGSLNEAGNYLIKVSKEQVGSNIAKELKKLNRRWAKFIKRTHFFWSFSIVMFFLQEAFNALDNKVLDKFLKAAEQLKNISPDHEKLVVEEKSKDEVHREIISYVQLIVEREKKKFNATFKKINKQLGKEKKLLSMDKTKGLIKEHEVPNTFLIWSPTCLCECFVCPSHSVLGTLLQSVFVEQDPCALCYELQRSILNQIEVCKQLEHLESSARDEFNPIDLQAASKIMIYYQNQLEEMSHKMQIRETVLKDLEDFMASLRKCQSSIKCLTDPPGHPETQGKALREAAQEVSRMVEKAKCLDERLKTVDICLEDGECGRKTCCENLVLTLSEALKATCDSSSEQMLSEEKDLYEIFSTKNCELLKNIQDLCDRINKIGLKDPTIPAVQQRLKSLMELEKELDRVAVEMKPMQEIANKLLQIKEEKAEEANEQCRVTERLWEDTKLLLAECQEQCARALELLKQYQSCKTSLTSIIQKQEIMLSQQASYMGKENLNRLITKIEEAKEEFNEHSEDVDKINQICKNLQLQLNKMRSFEEPPFENEANIIVDRWLDINEKTENYCDNLGRVQALWDKLLGLSGAIDAWANAELKNAENHCLTEEDLTQLKACLRVQEQKLQKFDNTVAEIEELLNSNEPPLELQVIRSSVVQKMELIKELLSMKQGTSELSMNTAELKGDLDLAKTQIGMTESLLKALSPSDTLEIFTKLEEIHQKILQQEHLVTLLQEETDCPDVDELNKQLKCVIDLFNKKKRVFQDHFIGVLNRQCKNFNDWFSSTQLSLKDCFDLSETKPIMEERLQRLTRFLTSEGKDRDIQEVKTLLDKVKHYLSKASIIHLNSCVRDQEAELQRLVSKCQKREKELGASLQQLSSLEESSTVLEEWLIAQEEKLKEIQKDETKLENFYKTLLAQRKPFDSMAQLVNSLRETGLTEHETVSEAAHLLSRYQTLITHVSEMTGNTERLPVEGQNFEELVQDVSCWIKKLEEAVNNLSSQGSELPSDKRINQIKEITALRDAGEAKIQKMVALGETLMKNEKSRKPVVQQTISELQNKWESICHAVFFPSPQEQLQFNRERYEQSKEDLRLALTEVEKQQQEIGFALQPGLKEKQAQLTNYANLLQKAENLTSRFNELESQEDCLQGHTGDSCFPEMEWLELKHQHENLLSQLQTIVQTLESHVQEHQQFQDMVTGLSTELKTVSEKMFSLCLKEQQGPLSRCEDMLKKILVLAETVKQNTSSPGQKFIKDEIETLQSKHRSLEERLENVEQKEENIFTEVLELKDEFGNEMQMEDKADAMLKRETRITSDTPVAAEESPAAVELKDPFEMHDVSAEVVVQKELFPGVQVNTEYFEEEQKVNELKNKVAELDIVLINEQLKELEGLFLNAIHIFDRSPMNNTVLLEKIKACIESLRKERDVLNQLKTQQESLSQHLTGMDKVLTESQMRQLELWWQHMEQTVQKKHDQVVAEIDEFNLLMNKAQDIQKLIQEQCLQVELHSSAAGKAKYPVLWMTELQDIKHGLSLLTRRIELQMKRIWSDQEKVALESSIRDLQSKLEALSAQQTPREDVQITGPALMKHEMMKKMKENISWVKDSLSSLDQKAALFPSDVKSQIRSCQLMSTEVLNREPVIVSLDYGLQHIMPSLKPEEVSDMKFLLQTLQDSYKALVLKSAQRLQHLELQLEERQRLIAEIEKVHCQLRNAEMLARPDMNQTSTWSELIDRQAILKEILKDVQEIEGLISSHYKESQITAEELSLSEQLFLIDQLRSLKNRAKKTQRQIQSKLHEVEKKIAVYKEFAEGITSLQQDLVLQYGEMNLEEDELLGSEQELKDKCKALQKKVLAFQFNLSQIMKYKEIFECVGLKWDSLQLDELQTKFFKIKNKIKGKIIHFDNVVRECDKIQVLLNEIQAITSTVRKEADILNDGSCSSPAENLMSAQILFQAVQQILYLTQEVANKINKNDILDTRFKESKRKEIKSLEKDAEELNQFLQNLISGLHCVNKEDIQNEVEYIFHIIKHIQLELQQPLLIDIKLMQYEKLRWEAIQKMMQAKFSAINCIMEKERKNPKEKSLAAGIETKLETLQDHETQLKIDISALEEACKAGELYTKAVQRAATFLEDYEAGLQSATAELGSSEEICQTPQWNQEEFNSAKADIENVYSKLKNLVKPEDKICLENTLTELVSKSLALREKAQRKEADEQRYFEKYKSYTKTKDKVCDNLNKLEKMLRQSLSQIPTSYKEALEHLEESKILVSNIDLAEDDLVKLRQVSGDLMKLCCRNDRALGRIVTVLWENWLSLLEAAKGLEINCEELKQEWKFINEELEREAIILDKLQEEQPESLKEKEKATREELVELLDFVNSFEENINQQQLLLLLLLHRIRNILNTSENTEAEAALPALCEIKAMQDRCKKLYEKTQDHKDSVQAEIQERNKITEEISAVTNALRHAASGLSQDDIMEKLRTKYSEMHTTVPAEIQTQLEDSKKVLQDLEDKVSFEILQSSPQYVLKRKAETINNGLQAIEKMLQQKSENIAKAKEVQKQIWDMLDLWHYKLNELDEEVHDIVEQNSCHAQELMDILVTPLQQYQQVSQLAERRTAILNKAANKMEEYDELLKNVKVWIENTNCLLKADAQINSGKSLRKHTDNLQMALEDSEQKQKLLHSVYLELEELTPVFETDSIMQQLNEINDQVATLQHEIAEILPQIQHVADELDAIESHVKVFEKEIAKMKTILSSEDLLEFSPKDQLQHGQVILDRIGPMQKTIAHIQSYKESLQLPGVKMQPFSVFQTARQLLRELKKLEKITKEQSDLLEVTDLISFSFFFLSPKPPLFYNNNIVRLSDIEQKVLSLMGGCGDSPDYQQETESLSLKLKEVKSNLEEVQRMLQDTYDEDQVKHMNTMQSKSERVIVICYSNSVFALLFLQYSNGESDPKSKQPDPTFAPKDQADNKWQHFQQDLSSEMKSPLCQLVEPPVRLNLVKHSFCRQLCDKKDDLLKCIGCAGESTDEFCKCFNNLQAWLEQTAAATASRSNSMKDELDHNSNYQNETRLLYDQLTEKKATLQQSLNAIRGHNISEQLQKTNACVLELEDFENKVAKLRGFGERFQLPTALIQEVYKLEDVLDDMWGILKAKYEELYSPSTIDSQYEDLLRGFADLVAIGQEKIAQDPKQLTKSKAALQSHLENHKNSIAGALFSVTGFSPVLWRRITRSQHRGGTEVHALNKEWMEFDDECLVFNKELEALASALPSVNLVEETEERLMERIALLEQIKSSVDEKHARLYQMVKEGKKLMAAVSCPEIRSQIGKLEEQRLSLTKKVGHELHRLQTLLKLLISYNRDSEELMKWLDSAQQRINFWTEQSLNVSPDLPTIRDNINSLLAFSKEADEKSSLKTSVVSTANQLFHVKQADTTALRSSLAKFEQKWGEMTTQLSAIQEKLHQLQMEKLSSREAIAELMAWLDHVEQQLGHEEPINSQRSAAQVKSLLQKYKEYMMEMNFKQWTVDFVNQSLLQMSTCDVESKRYERTEFAECLGELNLRWHRLQASLNRKIQDLEYILEDIIENENKAQTLHNWLEAQSDQLRSLQTPASLISAQNTLDVCKELENQLTIKSKTLDELKQSLALNGSVEQSPESPSLRIAELCEMVDGVVSQVAQLKTSMQSILEQWRVYDEAYAEVSLMTTRYLYCINHCKPSVASLEALEKQVNTLQSLQDESESSEESWAKLQAAASNLKKNCSPSFAEIMEQKCMEAHTRWNSVNEDITDQLRAAQATMQLLEPLNTSCTEAAAKLQQHEEQYNQLLDAHMPEDNMIETLHQRIQDIRTSGTTAETILLEKCEPLQRAHYLEKMLQRKLNEFEAVFFAINLFFYFQNHTLELAALSPNVKSLNETSVKLPLSDFTLKKMQSLTRLWSQKRAAALEHWSKREGINDDEKKIFQKCENWMKFLEKMRDALKTNIPERFEELKEQQRVYECCEWKSITIVVKCSLEVKIPEHSTLVIFRREFISKLLLLKEQWQNLTQTVLQRKKDIDGLVSQWQLFRSSQQSLGRFLDDMNNFLAALKSQGRYSPHHVRNLIHDCKIKAVILQRWQAMYSLTIDVGEKLRTVTDPETSSVLQEELISLPFIIFLGLLEQNLELFEKRTKELESRVQELKEKSEDLLPVEHEELYKAKEHIKELEQSLADCTPNMKDLLRTKVYVGYCFFTEDMKVLREQAERLHRQWEELCLRVSLRKQEIEDRLNAWIVFNEKNKELCSWLVQMESKVLQTADVSIEDMIDKLQKDCMEEINLFSENKLQLKQMGDQLIKASSKNRVAEIDDKLNKINDRWQHLFDVIGARVKKLKETFAFIQLLDKNMSNLRTWLARIESELSKPVVYDICDDQEIQKRLAEQQDLQRDIEQHTAGVESVFNICEVLLHDSDACANETECDSIQQTTRSLDRRWRNICAMSMERRMKIEETWHLWQRFFDDYSRFEDWLKSSEMIAAKPNSSEVLYTHAKEELKKFEAFQRHVHERLTQLELINKQYRRLARENRTDSASKLKQMVHEGNQRWDNLQKRVAAILRRLKHFTSRRDEFEGLRESILVWLTEMDLQLTNVEHFSKSNFDDKMRQLNGFQQEITLNTNKIDQLIVFGEQLIQKSEPLDATLIEGELEELHRYCQEVFGRVARFHQRLTSRHPGLDDEKESSENETDPEDSGEIQNDPWHKKASAAQSLGQLMPPAQGHERSGCETPVSVDSIPLEWDHTGDVGGSSSPEDEEEATYYSALSEKSLSEAHPWHSPDSPVCRKRRYHQSKIAGNVLSGPETSTPYKPDYVSWRLYGDEEPQDDQELVNIAAAGKQPGIIDRWELIQAQDLRNKLQMKQKWQQWQQLNSDLGDVSAWLDKTEEKLEELQKMKPPTSIQALGQRVKKLKDILKAFDNYRAVMLSINRSSKEFQEADSTELKELQNKLQKVNLHWETVAHVLNNWKKGLQQALLHCQDFHDQSQKLTLWLASADRRRDEAQITDPNADLNTILKSQKELMQLEKELLEQQRNISPLQELTASLLPKSQGDCIQDGEKVHVIGSKLKRLTEQVSDDLKTIQGNLCLFNSFFFPPPLFFRSESNNNQATPQSSSFFYRVLRAALPFQLSFLILLLLAFMVPFSEEDYSCTRANNFARSFSLMLVYTNGPPPT
uniref:Spectrin repeat containing nuclear envelope protein 2 n=1 Tax=Falco tinnunculus TaxID=100819 RepID=A0A8C4V3B0_FALTI